MRLLHIADLHLGKTLGGYSLIEDQRFILDQILRLASERKADAILVAGDIYDRTLPSLEAVSLLDDFISEVQKRGIALFLLAGNHDSQVRLSYAARPLASQNIFIESVLQWPLKSRLFQAGGQRIRLTFCPFLRQIDLRHFFEENNLPIPQTEQFSDYFQVLMEKTIEGLRKLEDEEMVPNLLILHQWIVPKGQDITQMESVGGVDPIRVECLEGFDGVAAGHIHKPLPLSDTCAYAGSPLIYSERELGLDKSIREITLNEGKLSFQRLPLTPLRAVRQLKASLETLLEKEEPSEDYLFIHLQEPHLIPHLMSKLQDRFPHICQVRQELPKGDLIREIYGHKNLSFEINLSGEGVDQEEGLCLNGSSFPLSHWFEQFFREETGRDMDPEQRQWVKDCEKKALDSREGDPI